MPTPQEIEAAKAWFAQVPFSDQHHQVLKDSHTEKENCSATAIRIILEALIAAESQLSEWSNYLKKYPNARKVNAEMKRLDCLLKEMQEQLAVRAIGCQCSQVNRMAKERDQAREDGARMRERLKYIGSAYCDDLDTAKEFADKALRTEGGGK